MFLNRTVQRRRGKEKSDDLLSKIVALFWCEERDLNPHVKDTRTSNVPVCLFQHPRISLGTVSL